MTPPPRLAPLRDAPFLGVGRSARGLRWVERLDPEAAGIATAVAQRHGLPDLLARIMVARGAGLETAGRLLDPALRTLLPDPSLLRDMDTGAARLARAIMEGEPIALFGDYDVDGAASVALVQRFLRAHGREARIYIPDRLREGYGPSRSAFAQLIEEGAALIVTLDCGTTSAEVVDEAVDGGVDVLIVDHHLAGEHLPRAHALINPNRLDDTSGQGHLAAAGVVFLLLVATARVLREAGYYGSERAEPDLLHWLDMVALATVCDVVSLHGVNRAYVAKGLQVLGARRNVGLRVLADVAGLSEEATAYHLGFLLGPRINAGGRIGEADLGVRLLLTEDELEAARIAQLLDRLNRERKALETCICEQAQGQADAALASDPDLPLIVCAGDDWHKGVIGLVASRLVERFRRPALVIAWDGQSAGTGSLRSVPGVDIGSAVRAGVEAGLLLKGGGHAMAAGLTVRHGGLAALTAFLRASVNDAVTAFSTAPELKIDAALMPAAATAKLMETLDRAGPFGTGNPLPRFAFAAHRCMFAKIVGETHVRCILAAGDGSRIDAIAFRSVGTELAEVIMRPGAMPLHVAGHLRRNAWGGRIKVELMIEDVADPRAQRT